MNATKRRSKALSKKANGIASRGRSRARKQHANDRDQATERLVNGIVDGIAVAGAMFFIGGAKFVAVSVRETERSRCRRIVAERLHRDPKLIREILSEIDGDADIEGDDPQEGVSPGYST